MFKKNRIECDVVIADQGWADLSDEEIAAILQRRVIDAVTMCLAAAGLIFDLDSLVAMVSRPAAPDRLQPPTWMHTLWLVLTHAGRPQANSEATLT